MIVRIRWWTVGSPRGFALLEEFKRGLLDSDRVSRACWSPTEMLSFACLPFTECSGFAHLGWLHALFLDAGTLSGDWWGKTENPGLARRYFEVFRVSLACVSTRESVAVRWSSRFAGDTLNVNTETLNCVTVLNREITDAFSPVLYFLLS